MSRSFELAGIEKMFSNPFVVGDFIVMGTSFVENDGKEINASLVRKALVLLQKRHPFLAAYLEISKAEKRMHVIINDDGAAESRIQLEWLDLTNEVYSRQKVIDESARFNSKLLVYSPENLLWKVQVVSYKEQETIKYVINLVSFMGITDGLNITTLSIELLNILNALLTGQECDEMKNKLEPCESLYELCIKNKLFKEEHNTKIEELNKRPLTKFKLDNKFRSYNESGFFLDLFKFDKTITSNMLAKCKANDVRLSGFLHTSLFYALKELYIENGLEFPKKLLIELAASLRVRYQPVLDFSNCRFHTVAVLFPVDENLFGEYVDFWQDARYIHGLIAENTSTETGTLFSLSHSDSETDAFNNVFADNETYDDVCRVLSTEVACDVVISNLGRFNNDNAKVFPGPLKIKELYCTDSLNSKPTISAAMVVHTLFWQDEIMFQIGANKHSIGSAYLQRLKEIYLNLVNIIFN